VLIDKEIHKWIPTFIPYVKDCLPVYFALLDDKDEEIRERTIVYLGSIGQSHEELRPIIIPNLIRLLDDSNEKVSHHSSESLINMGYIKHLPEDQRSLENREH